MATLRHGYIAVFASEHLALLTTLLYRATVTDATCNSIQLSECRAAADRGQLSDYRAGGQCLEKQYVQYTHLCTVNDYLPSIDHCCCRLNDARLLCCRYHHYWYHFRCSDTEDAVELRADTRWLTSWQFLVPVILIPLVGLVALVVIGCVCRKLLTRRRATANNELTSTCCSWMSCLYNSRVDHDKPGQRQLPPAANSNSRDQVLSPTAPSARGTVSESFLHPPAYSAEPDSPPVPLSSPIQPSAPPLMTSEDDYASVTSRDNTTARPASVTRRSPCFRCAVVWPTSAPLCGQCNAHAQSCVVCAADILPPSYEVSQRLQNDAASS